MLRLISRKKLSHFFLILILLAFQNCILTDTESSFNAKTFLESSSLALSAATGNQSNTDGNGTGYDGKLFYSYLPNFSCESKEAFKAQLNISGNSVGYLQNSSLQCGQVNQELTLNDLDFSPFHESLVGLEDKIFEYSKEPFVNTPDRLVEAWCFNETGSKNIEVIQQYNRNQKTSTLSLYVNDQEVVKNKKDIPTSRIIGAFSAQFKGTDYSLYIDRQKLALNEKNQYFASMVLTADGKSYNQGMKCRLGGTLSSELWPSKAILDTTSFNFLTTRDTKRVFAVADLAVGRRLVEVNLTSGEPVKIIGNMGNSSGWAYMISPDERYVVYLDNQKILYTHDLQTGISKPITSNLVDVRSWFINQNFKILGDEVYFFEHRCVAVGMFQDLLKKVKLDGTNETVLYTGEAFSHPGSQSESSYDLKVAGDSSQIIYVFPNRLPSAYEIYSVTKGSNLSKRLSLEYSTANNSRVQYSTSILVGAKKEYLIYYGSSLQTGESPVISAVDGTEIIPLAAVQGRAYGGQPVISTKQSILIHTLIPMPLPYYFQYTLYNHVVKMGTWKSFQVPVFIDSVADSIENEFYGLSEGKKLFRVMVDNEVVEPICPEISSADTVGKIVAGKNSGIYFVAGNSLRTRLYNYHKDKGCRQVNEMPVPFLFEVMGSKLIISPDEKSAGLITGNGFAYFGWILGSRYYWIPLDGRAALKLTTPEVLSELSEVQNPGTINNFFFSADSKSIFFDRVTSPTVAMPKSIQKTYQWKLPTD